MVQQNWIFCTSPSIGRRKRCKYQFWILREFFALPATRLTSPSWKQQVTLFAFFSVEIWKFHSSSLNPQCYKEITICTASSPVRHDKTPFNEHCSNFELILSSSHQLPSVRHLHENSPFRRSAAPCGVNNVCWLWSHWYIFSFTKIQNKPFGKIHFFQTWKLCWAKLLSATLQTPSRTLLLRLALMFFFFNLNTLNKISFPDVIFTHNLQF